MLKWLQVAVAAGVLVLFWRIYPGVMALFAGLAGLCYLLAALAATRDWRPAIWLAFVFTLAAFAFSTWGVYRYLDNGFEYLSGNFSGRSGIYWPAYLFLLVAVGALAVIGLHVRSWRWMAGRRGERLPQHS